MRTAIQARNHKKFTQFLQDTKDWAYTPPTYITESVALEDLVMANKTAKGHEFSLWALRQKLSSK